MKKIVSLFIVTLFAACLVFTTKTSAQSLSTADIKSQMVADWQRAKEYTTEYLNTMPAEKYGAKAVDSTRSFAQQMLHLAAANAFIMATAAGTPPPAWASFTLENRESAQSSDSVKYFVNASYDFAKKAVEGSDMNKWGETIEVFGQFKCTRYALLQKGFEHQTHHRGQTTIYIRLQDIRPPQEKLF
ncbi:MAG TPA: DinB family protein [Chitinophagaceae bacterium]|nr:DinB family protein [Chitinophagaceae bacterium]